MKKLLLCAAASLCLCSQAYDMLFDGANLKQNEQKTSFWIFAKEKDRLEDLNFRRRMRILFQWN